jgi:hypothetical protein
MVHEEFVPPPIPLRLEPILRFQRYRSLDQVATPIREVAEQMVGLAEKLIQPRVVSIRRRIAAVTEESLALEGGPTFRGRCLGTHLRGAVEATCFVATIGPGLDYRVAQMADGNELLEALFLDTAGWLAVEGALRAFRAHLASAVRARRLRLSPRLGPGYLDWSLTEQTLFFSAFDGAPLPVALSEHCVMTPKKSLTGLFGLIPTG